MLDRLIKAIGPKSADDVARERILALYQRFWHGDAGKQNYRTAALLREGPQWVVVTLDGEFRGDVEITLHDTLESARNEIVDWVGEPREITTRQELVPATLWTMLRHIMLTGDVHGDPE